MQRLFKVIVDGEDPHLFEVEVEGALVALVKVPHNSPLQIILLAMVLLVSLRMVLVVLLSLLIIHNLEVHSHHPVGS